MQTQAVEAADARASAQQRFATIRNEMHLQGIDVLICFKPQNTFHLSAFNPIFYSNPVIAIVPLDTEPILLVHAIRSDPAHASSRIKNVRLYGAWGDKVTEAADWLSAVVSILSGLKLEHSSLGVDLDYLPAAMARFLESAVPRARIVDTSPILNASRFVKNSEEISAMRAAAELSDIGMRAAAEVVAARGTERAVSVAAVNAMNDAWSAGFGEFTTADFGNSEGAIHSGLWSYCLTGDRVAQNCDNSSSRPLVDGDLAMVHIFSICNGMHAENERIFAVGTVSEEARRVYETLLEARHSIFERLRPGITCGEACSDVASIYRRNGYEALLPGRMGHGLGLAAHEAPFLASSDTTDLTPGMVLTVEPSLRVPALGGGGGQHSDMVLITETGFEFLTQFQRNFVQA